jgi:hypothetical protein
MAHHGSEIPESMRRLLAGLPQAGATGRYPHGQLNRDDQGEIQIAVAADAAKGVVILDFGKPTTWVGFTAEEASSLADMLHQKALLLRGISP